MMISEQWSPLNTEGKKQYGRDFLIVLATDPLSMRKPENLPSMDIIKDSPNRDHNRGIPTKDWTPGFVKGTSSRGPQMNKTSSRDK